MVLAAAVALPVVAGAALLPAGSAAAADPLAQLDIATLDPAIGMPGATLRATGAMRVTGNRRLSDVELRLRLSRTRLSSRGELAAVAAGRTESRDGQEPIARQRVPGVLRPGQQVSFDLSVALDDLTELGEFGVYVVGVEAIARHRDGFGRVAIVRTFLPWVPAQRDFEPTGFTWLWPLGAVPMRLADGTYADDRLSDEMAEDGRLGLLAAAGARLAPQIPLAWVVDPALLEAAEDMSDGYAVRASAGEPAVDGTGTAVATEWLQRVRAASGLGSVISLPYADPDLVALRRNDKTTDLVAARALGGATTAEVLGHPVVTDIAWPASGFADRATLRGLRGTGLPAAILDARAIPTELSLPFTPSGRANIATPDGDVTGLLYDPILTSVLAERPDEQPLLAAQRFIAETAMITAELPSLGAERAVLIAPPRRWSPAPLLLDRVVEASLQAPWMRPMSLSTFRSSDPPEIDREPLRYPRSVRRDELPASFLDAVQDLRARIATFGSVLSEPDALVPSLEAAVLRLESNWWRDRDQRVSRLTETRGHLINLTELVQVLPGSYTFGSKSGTIPLTVSNDLTQAVTVDITLTASPPRLEVGTVERVQIAAQSKVQVEVPATAIANGPVIIQTVLRTPAGERYGEPVQLRVQVTQYGTVALFITGGAAAVLFAAASLRLFQRASASRRVAPPPVDSET